MVRRVARDALARGGAGGGYVRRSSREPAQRSAASWSTPSSGHRRRSSAVGGSADEAGDEADAELVAALVEKSEGNFMWLKSALEDIQGGTLLPTDVPNLPQGMGEMYRRHFHRLGTEAYRERLRPLLATLLVAEAAMSEDERFDVLRVHTPELSRDDAFGGALRGCSQYLHPSVRAVDGERV